MISKLLAKLRHLFSRDISEAEPDRPVPTMAVTFLIRNDAPVQEMIAWSAANLSHGYGPHWTQRPAEVLRPAPATVLVPKLAVMVRDDVEAIHFKMMWADWIEGEL